MTAQGHEKNIYSRDMKRPRAEDEFKFLTLKPLVSPDDPDLTLRLKRTKVVDGIPQYEFEIRHTYERYSEWQSNH